MLDVERHSTVNGILAKVKVNASNYIQQSALYRGYFFEDFLEAFLSQRYEELKGRSVLGRFKIR